MNCNIYTRFNKIYVFSSFSISIDLCTKANNDESHGVLKEYIVKMIIPTHVERNGR